MKNKSKLIIIFCLATISFISLLYSFPASYITKETNYIYEYGLKIQKDNQLVENQFFYDIPIGIAVWSSNNIIANCTFINCSDEGIVIFGSNNTIENCIFFNCENGIEMQSSSDNIIIGCNFIKNYYGGVNGIHGNNNNNTFYNCIFFENVFSVYISDSFDNCFVNCTFLNNKHGRII